MTSLRARVLRMRGAKVYERAAIALGVVLWVLTSRLDAAVRTAYETGWVRPSAVDETRFFGGTALCADDVCPRLASDGLVFAYALIPLLAAVAVAIALVLWMWRTRRSDDESKAWQVAVYALASSVAAAGMAAVARYLTAAGQIPLFGPETPQHELESVWLPVAAGLSVVSIVAALVAALVVGNAGLRATVGARATSSVAQRLRVILQRQRINLLGAVAYVALLLVVEQTSGQALDALRSWDFTTGASTSAVAFGLASTVLLALVLYESAIRLNEPRPPEAERVNIPAVWWMSGGVALLIVGAFGVATDHTGGGLIAGAVILGGLALAERSNLGSMEARSSGLASESTLSGRTHCELLAIAPLLAVAGGTALGSLDAVLTPDVSWRALLPVLPGICLLAVAVAMTQRDDQLELENPGPATAAAMVGGTCLVALIAVATHEPGAAAGVGFAALAVLAGYVIVVFQASPVRRSYGLALPLAVAAGLATMLVVHIDVHAAADVLGTLGMVNIALAGLLAALHYVTAAALRGRAPDLFEWFGIRQLPILSLILLWWVLAGQFAPATLHEVRLTSRASIQTTAGSDTLPSAPRLAEAFDTWRRAQPELRAGARGRRPVPMVLVASHGGGIRAAVWTAFALDCIVAVSPSGVDGAVPDDDEPSAEDRELTCRSRRRTDAEQRRTARRIFLASGVSGGAVGLQAYAQELLSGGLEEDWVDRRLGHDFASSTVGWGLFHDLPNHFIGLAPRQGGACRLGCLTRDRAAILEEAFDRVASDAKPATNLLRHAWDLRQDRRRELRAAAETVPLLVTNATVTQGSTRALVSAADFAAWPGRETDGTDYEPRNGRDVLPLAGAREVSDMLCSIRDIRLSTAAVLGARFPYVSPSGRISGNCGVEPGLSLGDDYDSPCARASQLCESRMVDGGYVDNSGLLTIVGLWPELRRLVARHNNSGARPIAPVIVELDSEYQTGFKDLPVDTGAGGSETFLPLETVSGVRDAVETFARGRAYRMRPVTCTVTIAPGLHPGLTAPLGWALSSQTQTELRQSLVRASPLAPPAESRPAVYKLRRLQDWLERRPSKRFTPLLDSCVPR